MTPTIFGLKKRSLCSFLTNELFQDKEVVIEFAEKHFFFSCTRPRVDSRYFASGTRLAKCVSRHLMRFFMKFATTPS